MIYEEDTNISDTEEKDVGTVLPLTSEATSEAKSDRTGGLFQSVDVLHSQEKKK